MLELSFLQKDDVFKFMADDDKQHVIFTTEKEVFFVNLNTDIVSVWERRINFIDFILLMRDGKLL